MTGKSGRPRSLKRKLAIGLLWAATSAGCLAGGLALGAGIAVYQAEQNLPSFKAIQATPRGTTIRYLASDGSVLHREGPAFGEWVSYASIPAEMRKAIVAIEDHRYRTHQGVDPIGLMRAVWFAWSNRGEGRRMQGASAITQQVARTIFLTQRYDFRRKLDEMIVAMAMERKFSKDQILELYLNRVYFGGGAYGIDAASRRFFGHDASTLTISEAALLAGLPKAPSSYAPSADEDAAIGRASVVLAKLRETGQDPNAPLLPKDITFKKGGASPTRSSSRHFIDWIDPQVSQLAPGLAGNVDVHTTLDLKLQEAAVGAIKDNAAGGAQGAMVSMEENGAVRSMIGGLDYRNSTYNRATEAQRQPGSSFKAFVYLAALEAGYRPTSAVFDGPVTIGGWTPQNSSGRYSGILPLSSAFALSLNTVAARLGRDVGTAKIASLAHRLGVSSSISTTPSMVLGTSEVRLIDMVRSYATIASLGRSVVPYGISRIEVNGATVYAHEEARSQQMVSASNAADLVTMMQNSVTSGTGRAANFGRPTAGKTGTTNSNRDGWFIGFSGGLVTGVWMGRDDANPVRNLQGGRGPARSFATFMKVATANRPHVVTLSPLPRKSAPSRSLPKAFEQARQLPPISGEGSVDLPKIVLPREATPASGAAPMAPGRSRAIRPGAQ